MPGATLPVVAILALGGTIAAAPAIPGQPAKMDLDPADLVRALPGLAAVAQIRAETVRRVGSADLAFADVLTLVRRIRELIDQGVQGFVVTQGTDTLEETAFLLDRLLDADAPVVMTGAMRHTGSPGADGPANLLAAVKVAASQNARAAGTLVVANDEIHLARFVRKGHATSTATFQSLPLGPVGWVAENHVRMPLVPRHRGRLFQLPPDARMPQVALIKFSFADSPRLLEAVSTEDFQGAVIETYGAGHTSQRALEALAKLADGMPTVFASRTGVGEVHQASCDFPGSELRLLERGLIPSIALDGLKSRLLLTLLLAAGADRASIRKAFEEFVD